MEKHLVNAMKHTSRWVILLLMITLLISMVLGSIDLVVQLFLKIKSPDPYPFLIKTEDLYSVFSVLLIIIVGYELFKSLLLILKSDQIPVKSIYKVAAIALANKVITMNLKEMPPLELIGIACLVLSIGAAYFFFNKDQQITD